MGTYHQLMKEENFITRGSIPSLNVISPSHTELIILIRFIILRNNLINPCVKTEIKCNKLVNNEFKIMGKRDPLHQIMRVSN